MYAIYIFLILPFKLLYWSVIPPFPWLVRIFFMQNCVSKCFMKVFTSHLYVCFAFVISFWSCKVISLKCALKVKICKKWFAPSLLHCTGNRSGRLGRIFAFTFCCMIPFCNMITFCTLHFANLLHLTFCQYAIQQ